MPTFIVNCYASNSDDDANCNAMAVEIDASYARRLLSLRARFEQLVAAEPKLHTLMLTDYEPVFFDQYALPNTLEIALPGDGQPYVSTPTSVESQLPERTIPSIDFINLLISGHLPLKPGYDGVQWECGPHDTDLTITSEVIPWNEIEQIAQGGV